MIYLPTWCLFYWAIVFLCAIILIPKIFLIQYNYIFLTTNILIHVIFTL